jgi:hypothetical protein
MQIHTDGAKARKSARYLSKKCEIKNWDKVDRFQVVDFGRVDMPRWTIAPGQWPEMLPARADRTQPLNVLALPAEEVLRSAERGQPFAAAGA